MVVEFRHDRLDHVQLEIPMAFVNREARSIALAWIRKQPPFIATRPRRNQHPIFVRPMDPEIDALYLEPGQLETLLNEFLEKIDEMFLTIQGSDRCIIIKARNTSDAPMFEARLRKHTLLINWDLAYIRVTGHWKMHVVVDSLLDLDSLIATWEY